MGRRELVVRESLMLLASAGSCASSEASTVAEEFCSPVRVVGGAFARPSVLEWREVEESDGRNSAERMSIRNILN